MRRKENNLWNILRIVVILLLLFGIGAGTASASTQAGLAADTGINLTINSTSATGISAALNSTAGASITVSFNKSNSTATIWNINSSLSSVSINGSITPNGTISSNGTFTLNSSSPTDFFSITVSNAENLTESATLTGFRFVHPLAIGTLANTTVTYNNGSIPTSVQTGVYYFFNATSINISVKTIAKMDNVTANYTNVTGGTGFNVTGYNQSGNWYYNITNVSATSAAAPNVSLINITLTLNGQTITVAQPFIALMNFNPTNMDTTLGGATTNWTTISDFTNISGLTFEKISLGKIVFDSFINLADYNTSLALANLSQNLKLSQNNMSLNSAANALAAMNISATLTMYNLYLSGKPAILSQGQLIVPQGNTTGGEVTGLNYDAASKNLTIAVGGWSDYTIFALTNESVSAIANNASNFSMRLLGSPNTKYNVTSNRSDRINGYSVPYNLTTDANGTVNFNLTSTLNGTANVTATNGTNTTYNNKAIFTIASESNVTLTSISGLNASARPGENATFLLNLTNTGNATDNFSITMEGNVSSGTLNITSVPLDAGASATISLNVTNATQGVFLINVTATSGGDSSKKAYVNTTTSVTSSPLDISTHYKGSVTVNGVLKSATINVTGPDDLEVGNTTSLSDGSYAVDVLRNDLNPLEDGVSFGELITFKVNGIIVHTRTVEYSGTINTLDLALNNGTLKGTVVKTGTSIGISGATVNITNALGYSNTTTTNALGTYSISLEPAMYNISVSKPGYSNNTSTRNVSVTLNNLTTVPAISLSPNTVTVTADRTVGSADEGQNVSFNLTVVNTGDNATFSVLTSKTNVSMVVTNTTIPGTLLLNTTTSTGYVVVEVNNTNFGGWPLTITINNSSQSKEASITLNAIIRNASANYTNISSTVDNNSNVSGGAYLEYSNVTDGANVTGATLVNSNVTDGADVRGNTTLITDSTVTGENTVIYDNSVIKGTYRDSNVDNSTIEGATVDSSNLTGSTISDNALVNYSILNGAIVSNSTLDNVNVSSTSTITDVASLSDIILSGVTVTGDSAYDYEGRISGGTGWVTYQGINFTKVYEAVRISQLVIDQELNVSIPANINKSINDSSLGSSMGFAMSVNLSRDMVINISETGISPDGAGFSSGTKLSNFLVIESNETNTSYVRNHTLRLYFDTDPAGFNDVSIYYYNNSTSAWVVLPTTASGNQSGRWYVEAAPNHFSTFALMGTDKTSDDSGDGNTGSGGGGSGGGGGGGKSDENSTNIEVIEKYDLEILNGVLTSYKFKDPKNPIMFVNITGNVSLGVVTGTVEVLKGTSTLVNVAPAGLVYKNANIWIGTLGMAVPKNIKEALVKFKVENSWMSTNGVAAKDIVLVKWDGSSWIKLETKVSSKDDTNTYLEGKTNSFSPFAITAKVAAAKPTVTKTPPSGSPTPAGTAPAPAGESDNTTWILVGLIIVVIIGAAVYFLVVKKNE